MARRRPRIPLRDAPRPIQILFWVLAMGIAFALIVWAPWPWDR